MLRAVSLAGMVPRVAHGVVRPLAVVPSLAARALATNSGNGAVLDDAADSYIKRRRERELRTPPVPLEPGEMLLYTHGSTTRRNIVTSFASAGIISIYVLGMQAVEMYNSSLAVLSTPWKLGFAGVAGVAMIFAVTTARASIKYAVLTADGAHLRVYPYGSVLGAGTGTPVTIPIKLLSEDPAMIGSRKGSDALFVRVGMAGKGAPPSRALRLVFDKPPGLPIPLGPGSQLAWTQKGLAPENLPGAAAAASAGAPGGSGGLYLLSPSDREEFRRYALLAHVLQGHPVDMKRVQEGTWELERMREQLDSTRGKTAKELRAAEIATYWREAKDGEGRPYWYHELTWERRWAPPTVD